MLLCPSSTLAATISSQPIVAAGDGDPSPVPGAEPQAASVLIGTTGYAGVHHDGHLVAAAANAPKTYKDGPIDVEQNGVLFLNSSVTYLKIPDGSSHTLFVGETRDTGGGLGWASGTRSTLRNGATMINQGSFTVGNMTTGTPSAMIDVTDPSAVGGFGSFHSGGANFLFGDTSVRFLNESLNAGVYRQLCNRRDGQMVGSY
jgi:prepilin-type processing-associated H-X9-DG protein